MTRRTIDQLYALTIPEVQEIFLQMMQDIVDRAMIEEMVSAIEANDVDALFAASGFTPAVLGPILDRIEQTYKDAADDTVDEWPTRIRTPYGVVRPIIFNMRNQAVEKDLRDFSSKFVTNISEEARGNVRIALEQGMIRGDNPRQTALDIVGRINPVTKKREGGVIGLSQNQMQWSLSARRYLETGDKKYFNLDLRDKRFDSTVRKAIESGKPLSQETIGKLVLSYNNRALKYRADAVSRTETMQAINRGKIAAMQQGVDEGVFVPQQVKKWWDDTGDSKTRPSHRALGIKYSREKAIDLNDPFVSPITGAKMMQPGDTSLGAGAKDVVHCRCMLSFEVDWRYGQV